MSLPRNLDWTKRHLYEAGLDVPYDAPELPNAASRARLQRTLDRHITDIGMGERIQNSLRRI